MATKRVQGEQSKGDLSRLRVLDAAAECFRREGFHGSSIARISQESGMSPGHIYHFFENKEAIIEALAKREENDMAEFLRKMEQDSAGGDLAARINRQVPDAVKRNLDPAYVGLFVELVAEASRNPAVRKILARSDKVTERKFVTLAEGVGVPVGMDQAEYLLRMKVVSAMLYGLTARGLLEPGFDQAGASRLISQVVTDLLGDKAPVAADAVKRR